MIAENLNLVRQRILKACEKSGRIPDGVRLVCVTKEVSAESACQLITLGAVELGENRVQELVSKYNQIGGRAVWHLIGHLQTNKVKDAVRIASLIHSVDSERLAREIDKEAGKIGKTQDVLVQVNISSEESKFGIKPEEALEFIKRIEPYPNIAIKGLMTMAPESAVAEDARPHFKALKVLFDRINDLRITRRGLEFLSMGMSGDFDIAVEEGANIVRVGRALFK